MAFTPKDWRDSPTATTPLSAAALEDMEARLAAYADSVAGSGSAGGSAPTSSHRQGVGLVTGASPWDNNTATNTLDMALIRRTGADSVRLDMKWDITEPTTKGTYVWTKADEIFDLADAEGLRVLFCFINSPSWARTGGEANYKWAATNPINFGDFVGACVARYKDRGSGCHDWEIINEPNNADMFMPNTDYARYVAYISAAYEAVKTEDPTATVVLGGMNTGGSEHADDWTNLDTYWLQRCYDAGLQGNFDVLGYHPYAKGQNPATTTPTGLPTGTELVSNPTFDTNTTNWWGDGATRSRVTTPTRTGAGSLKIAITGGQWSGAHHDDAYSAVTAGNVYMAQCYVRSDNVSEVGVSMFWYNASHTTSGVSPPSVDGYTTTSTTTGWTLLTARAIAPTNTAFCAVKFSDYDATPSGNVHYIDDVSLKLSSQPDHGYNRISQIRAIMVANGDADKPMWVTEVGQATGSATEAVSDANQATYLTNAFIRLREFPYIQRFFVYTHRDLGTNEAVADQNYGLTENNGTTAKASFAVFRDTR